jgi:hypothetical protein
MQSLTRIINAISNGINAVCRLWNIISSAFKAAPKADAKAEAETVAPVATEETNETEAADVIETETVDVPVPPQPRGVAMEFFMATMSNQNPYAFPAPRSEHEVNTMNRLLAKINLTTTTWIDPTTFCADANAIWKQCVLNAKGYSVELAIVIDYVMAGQLKSGCSYFRLHTGLTLREVLGNGGYAELTTWARDARNLTLEGNLERIRAYANHPNMRGYVHDDMTLEEYFNGHNEACVASEFDSSQLVDSLHHLSKYFDKDIVKPLQLIKLIRKGAGGKFANMFRTAGIRDGGVAAMYGTRLSTMTVEDLVNTLEVLGKYKPNNTKAMACIRKVARPAR